MLKSSDVLKYGVVACWDRISDRTFLWSANEYDPIIQAHSDADEITEGKPYALSVAIGPKNTCVVQIIIFRDEFGYFQYMEDENVTLFDEKE